MHIFHFKCLHSKSCCGKWEIQFLNRLSFIDTCTNSLVIKCHANDAYDIMILLHEFSIGQLSAHECYLNISVTRKSACALQRKKKKTTIYHKRSHAIFKYDLRDMQKEKNNYHTSSLTLLVTTRLHRQCWLLRVEIASRNSLLTSLYDLCPTWGLAHKSIPTSWRPSYWGLCSCWRRWRYILLFPSTSITR